MKYKALAITIAFALTGTAQAAFQGTLGDTSSGSSLISVTALQIPQGVQIQITGLEDFNFGFLNVGDSTPGPITNSNVCVYATETSTYALTLDGGIIVRVSDPFGTDVAYDVVFTEPVSGTSMTLIGASMGTTQNTQGGFIASNTVGCNASELASLQVTLRGSGFIHEILGNTTYEGFLTLTVAPE